MKCDQIHNELIFYLEGQLSGEKMEAVSKHLEECRHCREFLSVLQEQLLLMEAEKRPEVSPYFAAKVMARIARKDELSWSQGLRKNWLQPAFFTILLFLGIIGGVYLGGRAGVPVSESSEWSGLLLMNDFEAEPIESFILGE